MASAEVADAETAATIRRAETFIARFDGGPCFALVPERVADGVADVDGFSTARTAFDPFDAAFTARIGFAPHVMGQVIWTPQCPAVDYLRRVAGSQALPPVLRLERIDAEGRGTIAGRVSDPAGRPLHLLWVSDQGAVEDLSDRLVPDDVAWRFRLILPPAGRVKAPQLLIAVAGTLPPIPAVARRDAAAFFAAIAPGPGSGPRDGAAAKLFLLGE